MGTSNVRSFSPAGLTEFVPAQDRGDLSDWFTRSSSDRLLPLGAGIHSVRWIEIQRDGGLMELMTPTRLHR
jgi:hypothetical protein